jgi:hypothetical protein
VLANEEGREDGYETMATWFTSALTVEDESKQKRADNRVSFLTGKYKECVQARPQNNGKQYTKMVSFEVLLGQKNKSNTGNWDGHDWDMEEALRVGEEG